MNDIDTVKLEALEVFGSEEKALKWLTTYHILLKAKPVDFLKSQNGVTAILQVLNSIKYGGVV